MASGRDRIVTAIAAAFATLGEAHQAAGVTTGDRALAEIAMQVVEIMMSRETTDPRALGGAMVDVGDDPFAFGQVALDTRNALLVDYQEVCKIDAEAAGESDEGFAILLQGRINQTSDRARVMVIGNLDLLAAMITECHGVAERCGLQPKLHAMCEKRWEEMPHEP